MDRYKDYSLEDFVLDAQFQDWVRYKRPVANASWQNYLKENPSQQQDILQASTLLESVYSHYKTHLNDAEIDHEIHELLNKVRADKNKNSYSEPVVLNVSWQNRFFKKTTMLSAAAIILFVLGLGWLYHNQFPAKK